jgi:hypothetical protein
MRADSPGRRQPPGWHARRARPPRQYWPHQVWAMWATTLASFRHYMNTVAKPRPTEEDEEP